MKKLISILLCAAMLLTFVPALALGAAADALLDNSIEVWSFNGLKPGRITATNWSWDNNGFFEGNGDTFMKAEITENGGVNNTQALKITMLQQTVDSYNRFLCFTAGGDPNNIDNWKGAEQLIFYVDASSFGTSQTAYLRLRVREEDTENVYAPANGKTFFRLADGSANWVTDTTDLNAVSFPAGFKGWIRIPLTEGNWAPAYNGSITDGRSAPDFDNHKISLLWVQLTGKTSNADFVNKSVIIDSFMISSESSGLPNFRIAGAFGDNMVLQADAPISVYGYGKAGQTLHVKITRDKDSSVLCQGDVTVDATGRWDFLSSKTVAGGFDTYTVKVTREDKEVSITGVLFGEVWVAGGQSNMEWLLSKDTDWQTVRDAQRNSAVRVMQVSGWSPSTVYLDPEGSWKIADKWDNIANCSAIGYYFAEQLQEELGVPVGLISTAAGGTPLAAWVNKEILSDYPDFANLLNQRGYLNDESWGSRYSQYNARIAPFKGMQASGIIWYQGCNESGSSDDDVLEQGIPVLYDCWNGIFNNTTEPLAFYSVQLTPYLSSDTRRSQTDIAMNKGVLAVNEKTGLALSVPTYDISLDWQANGTPGDNFDPIHPRTKKPVAERLAAAALGNYYGKSEIYSGPVAESFTYNDNGSVEIKFSNVGTGLACTSGTELKGFLVAADGANLSAATATITGKDTVLVTPASGSEKSVKVAYAYGSAMRVGNLCNSEGFLSLTFCNDTTAADEPADPSEFVRKCILDFEGLSGDLFAQGLVTNDYGNTDVGAEALAGLGYDDSVALAYHYNKYSAATYWSASIVLDLDRFAGGVTNWSYAGMLWFWANTGNVGTGIGLDVWLNGLKPALGTPIYSYDGTEIRQIGTMFDPWDGTGRLSLPSSYAGFIGIPLSAYSGLRQSTVNTVYLYMESNKIFGGTPSTLYLDEFWLTKVNEAPDLSKPCTHTRTEVLAAEAPTCTEPGLTEGLVCTDCGEIVVAQETVAALGHNYVNGVCSRCGAVAPAAGELKICSASLLLNEDLNLIYATEVPDGYETPYMVFTCQGKSHKVNAYTVNGTGQYCFELAKLAPQCMGDNISATLYATCAGGKVSVTKAEYSVREYCTDLLAKTDDVALVTLLSDLLTYGAAAQIYTGYKTGALVTSGLDLTPSTFTALSGKAVSFTGTQDEITRWRSASLVLSNDLAVRFFFTADSTDGLTAEVSINGRTRTYTAFDELGGGKYAITFDGIKATEFDDTVTAKFFRGGVQLGAAVNYSVNAYICGTQNSTNEPLAALVRALYSYGAAAAAYAVR